MCQKNQCGFSLVEMMVTIAVLAILATMAFPSFNRMRADQKIQSTAFDLQMKLREIRSKAINGGTGDNNAPGEMKVEVLASRIDTYDTNEDQSTQPKTETFSTMYSDEKIAVHMPSVSGGITVDHVEIKFKTDGTVECILKSSSLEKKCSLSVGGIAFGLGYGYVDDMTKDTMKCYLFRISPAGVIRIDTGSMKEETVGVFRCE